MKTNKINKQFFYKQAVFTKPTTDTLQNMLVKTLAKLRVKQRHETMYEADIDGETASQEWLRFINSPYKAAGCQFGVLVLYSHSLHHMVITTTDEEKDELDVSKLPPPEGKRFMESPLYFAVRDNHVVVIQSKSLRAEAFESHLNWLLHSSGALDKSVGVKLTDSIPQEIAKKITKNSVKRIVLKSDFFDSPTIPNTQTSVGAKAKNATGIGLNLLRALIPDTSYKALAAKDLTDIDNIQLNFEIKTVGRKSVHENDVMRELMKALRHVDNPDLLSADIKGVGTVKGSGLRVHDQRSVSALDGVLDTADAYEAMRAWLESLIDTGTVSGDH